MYTSSIKVEEETNGRSIHNSEGQASQPQKLITIFTTTIVIIVIIIINVLIIRNYGQNLAHGQTVSQQRCLAEHTL